MSVKEKLQNLSFGFSKKQIKDLWQEGILNFRQWSETRGLASLAIGIVIGFVFCLFFKTLIFIFILAFLFGFLWWQILPEVEAVVIKQDEPL